MKSIIAFITLCVFGLGALFGAVGNTGDTGMFANFMRKTSIVFLTCATVSTIVLQFI